MDELTDPDARLEPWRKRTLFDMIAEGWHDQDMMRRHLDSLPSSRPRPAVVEVVLDDPANPVTGFTVDPKARTLTFTVTGKTAQQDE